VSQRPPVRPGDAPDPAVPLRRWADERGSFVRGKKDQRWRWWVEDAATGQVVAFAFGRRTHATFGRLRAVLAAAGRALSQWLTDAWGADEACLPADQRQTGKGPLQRVERKHLTLRTRLKRLTRKTIGFSKKQFLPDGLITLFIFHCFF